MRQKKKTKGQASFSGFFNTWLKWIVIGVPGLFLTIEFDAGLLVIKNRVANVLFMWSVLLGAICVYYLLHKDKRHKARSMASIVIGLMCLELLVLLISTY